MYVGASTCSSVCGAIAGNACICYTTCNISQSLPKQFTLRPFLFRKQARGDSSAIRNHTHGKSVTSFAANAVSDSDHNQCVSCSFPNSRMFLSLVALHYDHRRLRTSAAKHAQAVFQALFKYSQWNLTHLNLKTNNHDYSMNTLLFTVWFWCVFLVLILVISVFLGTSWYFSRDLYKSKSFRRRKKPKK